MALTRAEYLEHVRGIMGRYFNEYPELVAMFGTVFEGYVTNGTRGNVADRREACRTLANVLWVGVLKQGHNPHAMRHYFLDIMDVPQVTEP